MPPTALRPARLFPRGDFRPLHFRRQIFSQGQEMLWERKVRCPCSRKHDAGGSRVVSTKAGEISCPSCGGTGYFFLPGIVVTGLTMDASSNPRFFEVYGELAAGAMRITLPPEYVPSKLDRFHMLGNSIRTIDEQFIRRGPTTALEFKIVERVQVQGTPGNDTVPTNVTVGIDSIRRADEDGIAIAQDLVKGVDYTVVDGILVWNDAGNPPPVGGRGAIRYQTRPMYVAQHFPKTHRDKQVAGTLTNMPVRVDCWLHDMSPWPITEEAAP